VRAAGNGYPELVTDHLRRVVAFDSPLETASPYAQAFNTGFRASDRRDPIQFAAKLVWAATYIRVMRNRPWWRRFQHKRTARAAADKVTSQFLARFTDQDISGSSSTPHA
jgi:hypothetical protein